MFFFKQKTAYEMRISDWSSDVCSSDLLFLETPPHAAVSTALDLARGPRLIDQRGLLNAVLRRLAREGKAIVERSDERRVGNECVVRVDLGGRSSIKKKITIKQYDTRTNQ